MHVYAGKRICWFVSMGMYIVCMYIYRVPVCVSLHKCRCTCTYVCIFWTNMVHLPISVRCAIFYLHMTVFLVVHTVLCIFKWVCAHRQIYTHKYTPYIRIYGHVHRHVPVCNRPHAYCIHEARVCMLHICCLPLFCMYNGLVDFMYQLFVCCILRWPPITVNKSLHIDRIEHM